MALTGPQRAAAVLAIASNRLDDIEDLNSHELFVVHWVIRSMRYAGRDLMGELVVPSDEAEDIMDEEDEDG